MAHDTFSRLAYPEQWRTQCLYPEALASAQDERAKDEPPGAICGAEHYRYGAFCFWLNDPATTGETLRALIAAASADTDPAMAQAALIDLVAHRNCDAALYAEAEAAFLGFSEQYFDVKDFARAHRERLPSWKLVSR